MKTQTKTSPLTRAALDQILTIQVLDDAALVLADRDYTDCSQHARGFMGRLAKALQFKTRKSDQPAAHEMVPETTLVFPRWQADDVLAALGRVCNDIAADLADPDMDDEYAAATRAELRAVQDQVALTANVLRKDGAR